MKTGSDSKQRPRTEFSGKKSYQREGNLWSSAIDVLGQIFPGMFGQGVKAMDGVASSSGIFYSLLIVGVASE